MEKMNTNPRFDFAVFPMGVFKYEITDTRDFIWNHFNSDHLKGFLCHAIPWAITGVIWKKNMLQKLGGFNESFKRLQDVELHTRALIHDKVNYKCYAKEKADCFYRITEDRIETNYIDFMTRRVSGTNEYVSFFANYLVQRNKKEKRKYLKGTTFEMLAQIYEARTSRKISVNELNILKRDLVKFNEFSKLLTIKDRVILFFYFTLKKLKIRIRGLNFLTKKLLIS